MFDRYVAQTQPNWKRRAVVMASLALHGIAAIVLVIWSFFHVEEIAPPAVSLTFFSAPPPPPPPPPPAKKKSSETKKVTPVEHKIVNPTQVNPIIQPKTEDKKEDTPDDDDGVEGGEEGGVKGGVVGGVKGGVVGGTIGGVVGGTGTGQPQGKIVPAFTLRAQQIDHALPGLPDWFKNQHAHQNVSGMYKFCVGMDGRVFSVAIVKAIGGVDDQVMQQIRNWTYKPQALPVCVTDNVQFKIN
jgi:protein TonB